MASTAVARRPQRFTDEPFTACCPVCRADVLEILPGVVVNVREIMPLHDCPSCAQVAGRGHIRSSCDRCGKTGKLGEPVPLRGVAIAADGRAREYRKRQFREGEAIHTYHPCALIDSSAILPGVPEQGGPLCRSSRPERALTEPSRI